jgi:hypothetical protein
LLISMKLRRYVLSLDDIMPGPPLKISNPHGNLGERFLRSPYITRSAGRETVSLAVSLLRVYKISLLSPCGNI